MTGQNSTLADLSRQPLNLQAASRLRLAGIPQEPNRLPVVDLMLYGLENGLTTPRGPDDPAALIAAMPPAQVMQLLTETDSGDPVTIQLPNNPVEAAATLLEELLASLKALPA